MLMSNKIDFNSKKLTKDKKEHYILIKGSTQQDIKTANIYTPNNRTSKYMKQKWTKLKG